LEVGSKRPGGRSARVRDAVRQATLAELAELLEQSGIDAHAADFRRYGSARLLYNFDVDDA
jgi:hypothetical protein